MKVNFSKKAIASMLAFSMLSTMTALPAHSAGVPVIDAGSIAQAVTQVKNQVQQIQQLQRQIESITGNGNYADLANNPLIRKQLNKYLPEGYRDIFEASRRGDLGALEQVVRIAGEREKQAQTTQSGVERQKAVALLQQAQMDAMMQNLETRSQRLGGMTERINTTTTQAEKQDLLNAITAESAVVNLEMSRMQVLMKQAEKQEQLANKQAYRDYGSKAFK